MGVPKREAASLPRPLTSFVGREREIAELTGLLDTARFVTAVGPGGVGKTRLALAAAAHVSYADGVRFVDLIPLADRSGLEAAVAAACGVGVSSLQAVGDGLVAALHDRELLLLLDNGDHVVHPLAVVLARLMSSCPRLRVLVTSCAPLSLSFERVYQVNGLAVGAGDNGGGDAVALFLARATAAGAAPARTEVADIERICGAVRGNALAIELAAARVPSLGLAAVARALADVPASAAAASADTPSSMPAALDWSISLLDENASSVLRRCAVFVARFDGDAAREVAGFGDLTPDDVTAGLAQLAENNLVSAMAGAGGQQIYRFLESVRQRALAGQADGNTAMRHLDWCAATLEGLAAGADVDELRSALRHLEGDVRAALAAAAAHDPPQDRAYALAQASARLLFRTGSLQLAGSRFELAAGLAPDGRLATADLARAAAVAKCRVDGEDAERFELAAAAAAQSIGERTDQAFAYARAAELIRRFPGMFRDDPPDSLATEYLRRARELDDRTPAVVAAVALAEFSPLGKGGVPADLASLLEFVGSVGNPLLESAALDLATSVALEQGDLPSAGRTARNRVAHLPDIADEPGAAVEVKDALRVAVFCCLGAGDLTDAERYAVAQGQLGCFSEQRDIADEETLAPAALAGHWRTVLAHSASWLADWEMAGRPIAPGRALGPTAVALTHGLRGDDAARAHWLDVVAGIRGVPAANACRGNGYGELFDALLFLHRGNPSAALDVLTAHTSAGIYVTVFRQWAAASAAEAAVLARSPDASAFLATARVRSAGNPIADALTQRAEALAHRGVGLPVIAEAFDRLGAPYQAWRTRALAGTPGDLSRLDRSPLKGTGSAAATGA